MADNQTARDVIENLTNRFNEASTILLGLDGVTIVEEEKNILSVITSLNTLKTNPSEITEKSTTDVINLFESYVHSRAIMETDHLTKLPNRSAFDEQMRTTISLNNEKAVPPSSHSRNNNNESRNNSYSPDDKNYFALVLLDLDRFKGLNDTYGHVAGDRGLRAFADILRKISRDDEENFFKGRTRVARTGGDEFSILLHTIANSDEKAQDNLNKALKRIRTDLSVQSFEYDGKTFPLVASSGMHIFQNGETAKEIIEKADDDLHRNKASKLQRYEYSVKQLQLQNVQNLQIVEDKRGKENEQLEIEQIGRAIKSLQDTGAHLHIHIDSGTPIPDACKTLQDAGISISRNYEINPADLGGNILS